MAGNGGLMGYGHGYCGQGCARHVWRAVFICVGVLAIFWIGMLCGEFRSAWQMERGWGPGMMGGFGGDYYGDTRYYSAYPYSMMGTVSAPVTLTRESTSVSSSTSTPTKK